MPQWSKDPVVKAGQKFRRREARKARCRKDPVFRKRFNRRKALQAKYGISLEDYQVLQESQNNQCGICGLEPAPDDKSLAVDHCHDTDYIRGLLCFECNTGLGKFKDDVRLLQRAIDWLQGVR